MFNNVHNLKMGRNERRMCADKYLISANMVDNIERINDLLFHVSLILSNIFLIFIINNYDIIY